MHALVGHDTHSKVVYSGAVIDSTHYFGSHVAWSSRSILRIFRPPNSGDSKVSDAHVAALIYHQVFRLDVSVNDILLMAHFQTSYKTCYKEAYRLRKLIQNSCSNLNLTYE
jgi:hypothetical protein